MLTTRRNDKLFLIGQNDHGILAGELVDHWGNDRFAVPTPLDGVRKGVAMHDEGWRGPDAEPLFNAEERRPEHFLEIEMKDHIPLYRTGVEEVLRQDGYAGLLVSMHWTGLYRGRWGMQTGILDFGSGRTPIQQLQDDSVAAQEQHWIEVKRELVNGTVRSDFEANLWHNYDLLQTFDLLSLFVCVANHAPAPADAEPLPLAGTLKAIDQAPGPRVIQNVPTAIAGERVDLVLRAVEPSVVTVDPWPFRPDTFKLSVEATTIPDRRYDSQADARAAVEAGEKTSVTCRMTRA